MQCLRRGGNPEGGPTDAEAARVLARLDWAPALKDGNRWYDRMADACREPGRAARERRFDVIDEELKKLTPDRAPTGKNAGLVAAGVPPDKEIVESLNTMMLFLT